jgi:hypothetical protein
MIFFPESRVMRIGVYFIAILSPSRMILLVEVKYILREIIGKGSRFSPLVCDDFL